MSQQKTYISLQRLSNFLDHLKTTFASFTHSHKMSDITDYTVDTTLLLDGVAADAKATGDAIKVVADNLSTHSKNKENPHGVTAQQVGLGNVDNTADADKYVRHATTSDKATKDGADNIIESTYETKSDAETKFNEAKSYADYVGGEVKNDLLNGAGEAYDTLKELGDLIDENVDAIQALEIVAGKKAEKSDLDAYIESNDAAIAGLNAEIDKFKPLEVSYVESLYARA